MAVHRSQEHAAAAARPCSEQDSFQTHEELCPSNTWMVASSSRQSLSSCRVDEASGWRRNLGADREIRRMWMLACGGFAVIAVLCVSWDQSGGAIGRRGPTSLSATGVNPTELKALRLAQLQRELRFMKAAALETAKEIKKYKESEEKRASREVKQHQAELEASKDHVPLASSELEIPRIKAKPHESAEQIAELQVQSVLDVLSKPAKTERKAAKSQQEPAKTERKAAKSQQEPTKTEHDAVKSERTPQSSDKEPEAKQSAAIADTKPNVTDAKQTLAKAGNTPRERHVAAKTQEAQVRAG